MAARPKDALADTLQRALGDELAPPPRLIMGPGPLMADPRVLRAMSMPLLGQFDPAFLVYMREVQALYRAVFRTQNQQTFLIDGSARAGIEAALVSLIEPGDRVLCPIFGRFGHLLTEIAQRCGGDVRTIETEWGRVFTPDELAKAVKQHKPKIIAVSHGDTSTTMAQPLDALGRIAREHDAILYVDSCATLGGMRLETDDWAIDVNSAGLQKCLSGPPGSAPITFNARAEKIIRHRRHIEAGVAPKGYVPGNGSRIQSNYFDLSMLIDYWSDERINHHTEATSMVYAARECARIVLKEGLDATYARHTLASKAMVAGLQAMGLEVFGDPAHKMQNVTGVYIPDGVKGDSVRGMMLADFGIEIGTSFGPLHGRIWRIGAMGYTCRKENVLVCLGALEASLAHHGHKLPAGEAVGAALGVFKSAGK